MSLYTYINILRDSGVKPEQLKPEFFDYVLCGRGSTKAVEDSTGDKRDGG